MKKLTRGQINHLKKHNDAFYLVNDNPEDLVESRTSYSELKSMLIGLVRLIESNAIGIDHKFELIYIFSGNINKFETYASSFTIAKNEFYEAVKESEIVAEIEWRKDDKIIWSKFE